MSKSNYLSKKQVDEILGGTAFNAPATVYMALFTVAPDDTGGGTEVTGGAYARVAITNNATNFPNATGTTTATKQNGTAITFPTATASWGTVVAWGIFDAAAAGNLLYWGDLTGTLHPFTAVAATDIISAPDQTFANGDQVRVYSMNGSTLPTGIAQGTIYFVVSQAGTTFKVSATSGGAAIDLTADGSGLVAKLTSQAIGLNGVASFAVNQLTIVED